MIKHIVSIGLNDKDKHIQLVSEEQAMAIISDCLISNEIDGAMIYNARGIYKSERENTLRVELYEVKSEARLIKAIKEIKRKLNQNCIAIEKTNIVSKYI